MFSRIKTLALMQMENRKIAQNLRNVKQVILYISIRLLITIVITALCYVGLFFFQNIMSLSVNKSLLLFVVGLSQILGIITIMFALTKDLYLSKDNTILFSLPVKDNEILISKLFLFYLKEFNKNLYFIIPLLFAFGAFLGINVGYVLNALILVFLLPLFPVLIGAILSLIYSFVKKLFTMFPYVKSAVIIAFVAVVYIIIASIMAQLPTPLRLLEIYNSFMVWLNGLIVDFNSYLLFYNNLINILFSGRILFDYLAILTLIISLAGIIFFVSMPFYFKIVCSLAETSSRKKVKKQIANKPKSVFNAFLRKEVRGMVRDTDKFTNYLISIISFPFILFVINKIFTAINTNALGDTLVIGFNIIIGVMLLITANTISSTAITNEGKEFSLLKTVPNKTHYIIWAKILVNVLISTSAIILGIVELVCITEINVVELLLLLLVLVCINSAHIVWSIQLDLLNPLFANFEAKGSDNNNPNIAKSVLIGVVLAFFFGIFSIYFMSENFVNGWIYLVCVAVAFLLLRIYLLVINLKVYFKRLEF